jgi:hypothetical protein
MPEIKWCCEWMKEMHARYGERGFGALVSTDLGVTRFLLQCRIADKGKELLVKGPGDFPISLVEEMAMSFCPACGVNLEKFYRKQIALFPKRDSLIQSES